MLLQIISALHDIGLTTEGMFCFLPGFERCLAFPLMGPTVAERRNLSFGDVNRQRHLIPILR